MKIYLKNTKFFSEKIARLNFNYLSPQHINHFQSITTIETENLSTYNIDWIKKYKGNSSLVLKPKSITEVSSILRYCYQNNLAICPQSGRTGLVGGSVPVHDEIILSMSKMNKIIGFDINDNSINCEAGCILETLNCYVNKFSRVMPLDLGAKGSCMIGGNLSTNAGGIHFIKYGSLRHTCKSLTVVLPNGEVVFLGKDNGTDLKQLIIGAEGTLGIIVTTSMYTEELLTNKSLSIIKLNSFDEIIDCYLNAKNHFKENLCAIEFFDEACMSMNNKYLSLQPLFNSKNQNDSFYLLLENSEKSDIDNKAFDQMASFLEKNNLDEQCVITNDIVKMNELWAYREGISSACSKRGIVFKYDVSLPLTEFYKLVEEVRIRVGDLAVTIGYGHLGDYNLHLNVCYDKYITDRDYCKIESILEPYIFDYLKGVNGSISAEHGVGVAKAKYLNRSQSEENIKLMKKIKIAIDPKGIMNPYKIFYEPLEKDNNY